MKAQHVFVSCLLAKIYSTTFDLCVRTRAVDTKTSKTVFKLCNVFLTFLLFRRVPETRQGTLLVDVLLFMNCGLMCNVGTKVSGTTRVNKLLDNFLLKVVCMVDCEFRGGSTREAVSVMKRLKVFKVFLFDFLKLYRGVPSACQRVHGR